MLKSLHISALIALFLVPTFAHAADIMSNAVEGELIVKYRDDASRSFNQMNALYEAAGVKSVRRFSPIMKGLEHLILQDNITVQASIAALQNSSLVEFAQPNYIVYALPIYTEAEKDAWGFHKLHYPCLFPGAAVHFPPGCDAHDGNGEPDDDRPQLKPTPGEPSQAIADPAISKDWGMKAIGAIQAWDSWKGSKDFIVADIDTGIDYNHKNLGLNVWRNPDPSSKQDIVGYDFVHEDGLPYDDNKHGTHTAGTIGAAGFTGVGISGVSPRVSIMALKFLSGMGAGTTANAIRAIDYAITHGAKVLNNSWGGPGDNNNPALAEAIDRARVQDVLFVAAAGNDGVDNDNPKQASYPASFDSENLISVAATDEKDQLASFSNYGKKTVHLAAPGNNVYSTVPGDKYESLSGTSMACPHVAGAAALLWSKHPDWNFQKVKAVLLQSVDVIPGLSEKTVTGGRLNILNALQASSTE